MKRFFAKVHLWLSVPFGLVIAIVCLSGAVLVFEDELLELSYPSRYFVKEVEDKPLSTAELMIAARKQLPESIQINGLRITSDPERTYQVVMPGKKAAAFINPYTGEITGMTDGQGFFMQVMRLHRWLLDSYKKGGDSFALGKTVVGISTLVFVLIIISGIVTWYPRSKKALKARLKVKTTAGWKRFFYDLHVTGGFYASLLLLVLALTGLTWSFSWYNNAFYTVFGVSQNPTVRIEASGPHGKGVGQGEKGTDRKESHDGRKGKDKAVNTASSSREKEKAKEVDYSQWDKVFANLQGRYSEFNSITVQEGSATVSTAKFGNTRGSDRFSFDSETGSITNVQLYKDLPNSGKIRGWIYSVHVGTWGGITTRILSCLVSLLGGVFVITGYYFWIKRLFKKRLKKIKKR